MAKSLGKGLSRHGRETSLTHIKDLVADPENRRKHNPRNLGMVVDALHQVGAARSIVIDEDGVILAGNGVTEAAAEAGITRVQVVDADGSTLVAVRRRGLSPEQKRALAIYDNRTAELAEWNAEQLQTDIDAGLDLKPWFFDEELAAVLGQKVEPKGGLTDPDDVPEQQATDIKMGDMFELGKHRLLCGDSTDAVAIARLLDGVAVDLLLTDPPYGVSVVPKSGRIGGSVKAKNQTYMPVAGDDAPFDPSHLLGWSSQVIVWGANYFPTALPHPGQWIVWDKGRPPVTTFSDCELAWTSRRGTAVKKYSCVWNGMTREGESGARVHPTQKPVKLIADVLADFSERADVVADLYLGSGTTLIASEQTDRRLFGVELEPHYVQVIIDRWKAFTGQQAVKVGEAVGV
jgi:DNA modification methylase